MGHRCEVNRLATRWYETQVSAQIQIFCYATYHVINNPFVSL
jgi:hypothetical protein